MKTIKKSQKLEHVCYDIRGPVMEEAKILEQEGYNILNLNIGNPYPFGLEAPDEILHDMVLNLKYAQGYSDSKGLFSARKAIMQDCMKKGIQGVEMEDIYTGNGVSELIVLSMQGLLNSGDEILIPAPDYPLWTAAASLSGGKPVHYLCDEASQWYPDIKDMKSKITPRTKGIVVINPNNPTGAAYPLPILEEIVSLAREHGLVLFADEIYEQILYDNHKHIPLASLTEDVLVVTFNGLSKSHRIAGFRVGWMVLSGNKKSARDYIEGLNMLSGMRLCSNVPSQFAIQTALGVENQTMKDLLAPGGRLYEQRELSTQMINAIPGLSCVKPAGAFYLFPKIDIKRFGIKSDLQFVLDLLREEKVLLVQGTGFNWPGQDHFRIVFLPIVDVLRDSLARLGHFLEHYQQI
ncbi:MAG: aminotransferase [Spirochaetae bacterium HGW-Spirochaetae-6]|nr:MAG: aminotransferase [Spirochaetae bacterium HGW-Spirochaetae-6]